MVNKIKNKKGREETVDDIRSIQPPHIDNRHITDI